MQRSVNKNSHDALTQTSQVKTVLRHFDKQIEAKTEEAHAHIQYWGNLYGFEKSIVLKNANRLCSPRSEFRIYSGAAKRLVGEVRLMRSEDVEASRDQKLVARYHFVRNYLHEILDLLQDDWDEVETFREEIEDLRYMHVEWVVGGRQWEVFESGPTISERH